MSIFTATQYDAIQQWVNENGEDETQGLINPVALMKWMDENTKKKKVKAAKKEEDPNRVKKPVPASWMYRSEKRDEIIQEHFEGEKVKGSLIAKKAQELWNELSDEEKRPYEEKRQELWDEYQKYKESNPTTKVEKKKKEEDPTKVKKPVPASWMYRSEKRDEIIQEHFEGEKVKGSLIAKKAQELWNELSDEEKRPYEEKRQELWEEYKKYKESTAASKDE